MTKKLLLVVAITIIVGSVGWSVAMPTPSQEGWERAQLKVLKRLFRTRWRRCFPRISRELEGPGSGC